MLSNSPLTKDSLGESGWAILFSVTATTRNLFSIFLYTIKWRAYTFWGVMPHEC
jgi:hypothetical protein